MEKRQAVVVRANDLQFPRDPVLFPVVRSFAGPLAEPVHRHQWVGRKQEKPFWNPWPNDSFTNLYQDVDSLNHKSCNATDMRV